MARSFRCSPLFNPCRALAALLFRPAITNSPSSARRSSTSAPAARQGSCAPHIRHSLLPHLAASACYPSWPDSGELLAAISSSSVLKRVGSSSRRGRWLWRPREWRKMMAAPSLTKPSFLHFGGEMIRGRMDPYALPCTRGCKACMSGNGLLHKVGQAEL